MTRVLPRCPRLPLSPEPARSSAAQRLTAPAPEAAPARNRPAPPLPGRSQSGPAPRWPRARRGASQNPEAWIPPLPRRPHAAGWPHAAGVGRKPGPVPQGQPPERELTRPAVRAGERGSGPAASACLPSCSSRAGRGLGPRRRAGLARSPPLRRRPRPHPRASGAVTSRLCVRGRRGADVRGAERRRRCGEEGRGLAAAPASTSVPLAGRRFRALPARVQPRFFTAPSTFSET